MRWMDVSENGGRKALPMCSVWRELSSISLGRGSAARSRKGFSWNLFRQLSDLFGTTSGLTAARLSGRLDLVSVMQTLGECFDGFGHAAKRRCALRTFGATP